MRPARPRGVVLLPFLSLCPSTQATRFLPLDTSHPSPQLPSPPSALHWLFPAPSAPSPLIVP